MICVNNFHKIKAARLLGMVFADINKHSWFKNVLGFDRLTIHQNHPEKNR